MKRGRKRCRKQVSSKKEKDDYFALLPDDLVLVILQKLPSDILRYKTRHVCKRWFDLISNRILLDHASLIIQKQNGSHTARLMDIREEKQGLKMKDQSLEIPYNGRIKSWCNEFLLITDPEKEGSLYIFNLVTKKGSCLPQSSISCRGHYGCKCGVGLSYDESKRVYKVVHVYMGPPIQCELIVLKLTKTSTIKYCGSSRWKKINGPSSTGQRQYYWEDPVSVQGRYFHWDVHCNKYLVSMDTVKEQFRETRLPEPASFLSNTRYSFVEMGGFLTLLHKGSFDKIDRWKLKDFQWTIWEKLQSISVSNHSCLSIYPGSVLPLPITCLKSKRYIIFRKPGSGKDLYSFDLKDRIMKKLDINIAPNERCVVQSIAPRFF